MAETFRISVPGVDLILSQEINKIEELLTNKSALVNVEIPDYAALITMLTGVDWWYDYTDDGSVYRHGRQQAALLDLWASVSAEFKACLAAYKYLNVHSTESSPYPDWPKRNLITSDEFDDIYKGNIEIHKTWLTVKGIQPPLAFLDALYQHYSTRCPGASAHQLFLSIKEQTGRPLYDTPENDQRLIRDITQLSDLATTLRHAVTKWKPSHNRMYLDIDAVTLPTALKEQLVMGRDMIYAYKLNDAPVVLSTWMKLNLFTPDINNVMLGRWADEAAKVAYFNKRKWFQLAHTHVIIGL